ncbi:multicopper oxidase domain-containing protein [Stutzerimonas kirkiae]|uniref:multicopper oxidase domain-containing protein n=1 Tax=Stutzerimonas kirkiae TaxID=2211392 RepID=UPI001F601DBF|nr:multicopper oxidase domain-containing protein [Stutzerimonas kirkiae]
MKNPAEFLAPKQELDTVVVRTRYQRYTGDFVLHCHILDHVDQSMMQLIRIFDSDPQGHHHRATCRAPVRFPPGTPSLPIRGSEGVLLIPECHSPTRMAILASCHPFSLGHIPSHCALATAHIASSDIDITPTNNHSV